MLQALHSSLLHIILLSTYRPPPPFFFSFTFLKNLKSIVTLSTLHHHLHTTTADYCRTESRSVPWSIPTPETPLKHAWAHSFSSFQFSVDLSPACCTGANEETELRSNLKKRSPRGQIQPCMSELRPYYPSYSHMHGGWLHHLDLSTGQELNSACAAKL